MDSLICICDQVKEKLTSQEYLDLMTAVQDVHSKGVGDDNVVVAQHEEWERLKDDLMDEGAPDVFVAAAFNEFVHKHREELKAEKPDERPGAYRIHRCDYDEFSIFERLDRIVHGSKVLWKLRKELMAELRAAAREGARRIVSDPIVMMLLDLKRKVHEIQ